ncbi:hypothetical protein TNCV_4279251 [Trichonephila clavipes]|nr:hypothetical protein TNCV_4279251 [Trichonephila clavipes]
MTRLLHITEFMFTKNTSTNLWTAVDRSKWSGSLAFQITGSILLGLFFWDHINSLEYEMPVPSVKDHIARTSVATEMMLDILGIFWNITNSMQQCCQACQTTSGRNLEHLL